MGLEYTSAWGSQDLTKELHFSSVPNVFGFRKGLKVIYRSAKSYSMNELQTCALPLFTEPSSAFP